jgi:hypothetical protein
MNTYRFYCPKCKSKLYPDDDKFIISVGVCGYCVTFDNTPDKRFKKAYEEKSNVLFSRKENKRKKERV